MYYIEHKFNVEEAYKQATSRGYANKCTKEDFFEIGSKVDVKNDYSVLNFSDWILDNTFWIPGLDSKSYRIKFDTLNWILFNRCICYEMTCTGREIVLEI